MQFAVKVASKALKNVPSAEKLLRNRKQFTFRKLMRHFGKTREGEEGVTKTKKYTLYTLTCTYFPQCLFVPMVHISK